MVSTRNCLFTENFIDLYLALIMVAALDQHVSLVYVQPAYILSKLHHRVNQQVSCDLYGMFTNIRVIRRHNIIVSMRN